MRRADRLFQLVQFLRRQRRAVTAQVIADRFELSCRTVYRDIAALVTSGVPIQGEPGVGYRLASGHDLPPLMFTPHELEAIALGLSMVQHWTDDAFGAHARAAQDRIEAVLPPALAKKLESLSVHALASRARLDHGEHFSVARAAILERRLLELDYTDERGQHSHRVIWPLGLLFFGPIWLLAAWCETRRGFRNFRLDRIRSLRRLAEHYPDDPERSFDGYLKSARPSDAEGRRGRAD